MFIFKLFAVLFFSGVLMFYQNCSKVSQRDSSSSLADSEQINSSLAATTTSVKILDTYGKLLFSDDIPGSSLSLKENTSYRLNLQSSNLPANAYVHLSAVNISQPNGPGLPQMNLKIGDNLISFPSAGDYVLRVTVVTPEGQGSPKTISASVQCLTPTFSSVNLNGSSLAVAAAGSNNLFRFRFSSLNTSGGKAPFLCGYDITGVGILDTSFMPCDQASSPQYIPYVGHRNIGVVVKDACNVAQKVVINNVNLNYSIPALGVGNVFIAGETSNAVVKIENDPRVSNVLFLSTNQGASNNKVESTYGSSGGTGTFTINASINHGMASSKDYGVSITLTGIKDTVSTSDPKNFSGGNINTAILPKISNLSYTTDQAGDQTPSVKFSSKNCTLTSFNARKMNVTGSPCSSGGGSANGADFEIWGEFSCIGMKSADGQTMDFSGKFDGISTFADSCVGGGGGGGGIVPIKL